MLGPSGIGGLYAKEALLERMPPFLGGGSMIHRVTLEDFEPAGLPSKFEAGTPPIVPAFALAAAIAYLNDVGLEAIHQHEQLLARRAQEILRDVPGLRILGPPPEHKGGIASFVLDGIQANDLAMTLDEQGVAVRAGHHCAMPLHARLGISASVRASFYLYNTLDEIDQLGGALTRAVRLLRR
jgi:cysteine desulfurase/selenocysteine lyase